MNYELLKKLFLAGFLGILLFPLFVFAQDLSVPDSVFPIDYDPIEVSDLTAVIHLGANFLIGSSPVVATIFIIWGGITYAMSGADPEKTAIARARIKRGFIGAVIVLGIGVLISTALHFIIGLSTGNL